MATDGLWEVMNNRRAMSIVADIKDAGLASGRLTGVFEDVFGTLH